MKAYPKSNLSKADRDAAVKAFRKAKESALETLPLGCVVIDPETGKDYTEDLDSLFLEDPMTDPLLSHTLDAMDRLFSDTFGAMDRLSIRK